jgi:probable selenium-dependent hydroxylase accessory protein YqeC
VIADGWYPEPVNLSILLKSEEIRLFSEHFAFRPHSRVNFVGGGGKTILIFRLMAEYCAEGPVLYTTTTRIHPPDPSEGLAIISSANIPLLKSIVDRIGKCCGQQPHKLAVTGNYMSTTLLRGVPSDFCNGLDRTPFPMLLNEADGAAGFPIKIPREHEPALMENAEYLVPVIGIDCLDKPLGPEVVFRWKTMGSRLSLHEGEPITPEIAASILMHSQGVCRYWKPGTQIVPFINKVDQPALDSMAQDLAKAIQQNRNFPVERVVYGSVIQRRVFS